MLRRSEEDSKRWRGWQRWWKEDTADNDTLMSLCARWRLRTVSAHHPMRASAPKCMRECIRCMCVLSPRVVKDGVRSVTLRRAPPAACQGWRLLPWDLWLSYPNCSQASKIKSPWDPFAWAGKPRTDNASQTPHWHFHGRFFFLFLHFSLFSFFFFFYQCFDLWRIFTIVSCLVLCFLLLQPPPPPITVVLFFCFLFSISMVTVRFPGTMVAGGLGGVKADGWLSHK